MFALNGVIAYIQVCEMETGAKYPAPYMLVFSTLRYAGKGQKELEPEARKPQGSHTLRLRGRPLTMVDVSRVTSRTLPSTSCVFVDSTRVGCRRGGHPMWN
ncbi:hypothetical protein IF1G_00471 [Cordyceps javanica]|uniref:Uncharacterized protein n=1 Tax=Cordyceps javanica TaxID=43265 RepID=A0A545VFZ6_9HYPO|nr:hypothetical protein IF1G_00471 [Cordyceps javanica]